MNKAVLAIAAAGIGTAAFVVAVHPIEATMPVYAQLAQRLQAGPVTTSFEPLGYSFLIATMPGATIATQAKILHFLCYVALAALTTWSLGGGRASSIAAPYAAIAILFNPYVLINLYRLNDNNVNVPAVVALFVVLRSAALPVGARQLPLLIGTSALLGGVTLVRPNAITLIGAGFVAVGQSRNAINARVATIATGCVLAAGLTYVAASLMMSGRPLFWPSNGPYNLFAGNNPAAMAALASEYNAESSLPDGLRWCGTDQSLRDVPAVTFTTCATRFWRDDPLEALRLSVMKSYTLLFRPNLRLADSTAKTALQMATMVLPLAWWTAFAWTMIRRREVLDPLALAFLVCYAAPFVVTNADPRFRLPLDGVYALSLASPSVLAQLRGEGRPASA